MFRLAVQQVAVQQASSFTPAYRKAAPLLVRAGWLGGGAAAVTASAALCELTQAGKARAARLRGETEELEEEEEAPAVATAVATSVVQENDEDGAGDDGGGAAAAAKGPAAGSKADKNYLEDPSDLPDPDDEATIEEALNCPCISGMKEGPCGDAFLAAYRCFLESKSEERGSDCIERFQDMQSCFMENVEYYDAKSEEGKLKEQRERLAGIKEAAAKQSSS